MAPARTSSGGLDTKTWMSSVPPMPSIISMPVACFHSWRVASGRASPADTLFLSDDRSKRAACAAIRSEEHTSELQSQSNLVCRLLLEKKKNTSTENEHRSDVTYNIRR